MRNSSVGIILTTAMMLVGCGDSTAPATTRNDAGTGTLTLKVTADIDADDVPGGFVTQFNVSVRDPADNPVSLAIVTISNATLGEIVLLETSAGSGDYRASRTSFPTGDFELDVVRGTDNVRDVVVGGLGVHTISAPVANDTVPALQDLVVRWNRLSQAKSAEMETRDYGAILVPDTGAVTVPAVENVARADQRIRVFRFNEVDVAGGLPGSRLRVKVRQTVEPLLVQ